ncbi:MAG TPA: TolC family protein [Rhodothermales bacterium]|nr:TolC family protein [Rhodothermales bacterium]
MRFVLFERTGCRSAVCAGIVCAAFALMAASPARGQQAPLKLTLEAAIQQAQMSSPAANIAQLQYDAARWSYKSFRTQYLPSFTLSGDVPGLDRRISNITQDDGSIRYVPQSQMSSSLFLSVSQPIPVTGGRIDVSSRIGRIDLFGDFAGVNQWQASPFSIAFTQPIFQFNQMKWNRRLEPLRYRVARRTLSEDVAGAAVDVASRFFDVYIAQMNVDRAAFNAAVNDSIYTLSKGRFQLGKIAENDLLQSELQLLNARTDLSDARIEYDRAMQNLKIALGLPYDREVEIVPPLSISEVRIDPDKAVEEARQNRSDFLGMQLRGLQAERDVSQARHAAGFSASLTAGYGLNQRGVNLADAYTNLLNQQQFSVRFDVPVFNWGRAHADLESALAQQEETQKSLELQRQQLEQEVYFEALQFRQLQQQVALAAKADTIAARRFEVARNRYTIGKIDMIDLFDAQRAKDASSQAYVSTLRNFWVSYFRLRRLTLFDFVADKPLIGPKQ